MAKGKKFDAAEKHFLKKEEAYLKDIRTYRKKVEELSREVARLKVDNDELSSTVIYLQHANDKLMSYCELSESDMRALMEHDIRMAHFLQLGSLL